ncbi:MAG: caspase family protein, partial [Rhabdochlamydiaceae bacterium]
MPRSNHGGTDLRYAICIGINSYASSAQLYPLEYAEKDARAMYEVLLQRGFVAEHCCLLLGSEATTQAIHDVLEDLLLNKPKTNDLVLFYFAGHGVLLPQPGEDNDETVSDV